MNDKSSLNSLNFEVEKELNLEEKVEEGLILVDRGKLDEMISNNYIKSKNKKSIYLTSSVLCALGGVVSFAYHKDKQDEGMEDSEVAPANLINNNLSRTMPIEALDKDEENLLEAEVGEELEETDETQKNRSISTQEIEVSNATENAEDANLEENKKEEYYLYNLEEKINPSPQTPVGSVVQPMTSNSVTNAMRYWNYFEYYGNTYGIDPYLLVAIACQESRGDHLTTIPGGKYYNGAGYGIMQIEKPGIVTKKITAYNHVTKAYEIMYINSESDVYDVEMNIKAGAMQLAQRAKEQQYNPYVTIQGYNYGASGVKYALSYYVADGDINRVEEIYGNGKGEHLLYYIAINNTDWISKPTSSGLTAREWYSSEGWKKFGAGRGDKNYIENIMRFYKGSEKPYILKDTGEKVSF